MKKVRCPKCGEEIDHLRLFETGEMEYFWQPEYREQKQFISHEKYSFCCPECDKQLLMEESAARDFLSGKGTRLQEASRS